MNSIIPDISVIVPILNESAELQDLLASLATQENVTIELILCDGGSNDGSRQIVSEAAKICLFPIRLIETERGRGHQMNTGAALATSELLLFLHADSRFEEREALCKAVAFYRCRETSILQFFAARFGLKFRRSEQSPSLAWFYYEAKARLPRTDCIRGDQGFLLNRALFSEAGGFDESLPFLEDLRLTQATSLLVEWQLLPTVISTSARRFEQEGLLERQILNAIIVNSVATEWTEFFQSLPGIYHCHADTGRLLLPPLLEEISRLIASHDSTWQRRFWQATGHHVSSNAWQLFFWLDVRRAFKTGKQTGEVDLHYLDYYCRNLKTLFQSRFAAFPAQLLTRIWLRRMLFSS